ncbi:MAG: hypothetical protein EON59_04010 [Alphaproteobacteria bacterium]|nr:MAG: hypothetical protein EON59_04010 [Alphaproteobacteria bacterium]
MKPVEAPADEMAVVQPEPRTEDTLDKVARKFKTQADLWKRVATNTDKLRLDAIAERDRAIAERDEARAIIAARREKAKLNLRQFKGKQGAAEQEAA